MLYITLLSIKYFAMQHNSHKSRANFDLQLHMRYPKSDWLSPELLVGHYTLQQNSPTSESQQPLPRAFQDSRV